MNIGIRIRNKTTYAYNPLTYYDTTEWFNMALHLRLQLKSDWRCLLSGDTQKLTREGVDG
jgi:hypothetical protein